MNISAAKKEDIPVLVALVNSAFRGEASKKGWTHEADLLHGELRTDEVAMSEQLDDKDATILKCESTDGKITGCVYLKKQKAKVYLGMLTVSPQSQGEGIGKMLLTASEEWTRRQGYKTICMTVITLRTELIAWYLRHGYKRTGRIKPFAVDEKFGVPVQPLFFEVLEKELM